MSSLVYFSCIGYLPITLKMSCIGIRLVGFLLENSSLIKLCLTKGNLSLVCNNYIYTTIL